MARHETDREDLFAELSTFSPRWELWLNGAREVVVVGKRADGRWSLYRQNGDYLQFLDDGRLRRAYWNGAMLLSTGTGLVRLTRRRTETESTLLRSQLSRKELEEFLHAARTLLRDFAASLRCGDFDVRRCAPPGSEPAVALLPLLERAVSADPPLAPRVAR